MLEPGIGTGSNLLYYRRAQAVVGTIRLLVRLHARGLVIEFTAQAQT